MSNFTAVPAGRSRSCAASDARNPNLSAAAMARATDVGAVDTIGRIDTEQLARLQHSARGAEGL